MSQLELKNISLKLHSDRRKNVAILDDVSFVAKDQEFVAIVGPSGCGKTTLMKIAAGLQKADKGEIFIDGEIVKGFSEKLGYVFQQPVSFSWLSVRENIEYGLKLKKVPAKERAAISKHLINSVGLRGYEEYFVNSLSGGMRQRVAIATVLANNPEVLLMDEPFSALDTQTKGLMQELLMSIWNETKKTVVFVTHDIEEAIFLADRVYVMSAKPGVIKSVVDINLRRPRTPSVKLSEDFFQIRKHLSYLVRSEAIKSVKATARGNDEKVLRVGLHTWPGISPIFLAQELGYFDEQGVDVELVNLEKDDNRNKALIDNEVDIFTTLADEAVLLKDKIDNLKIVSIMNNSIGGDGLIAKQEIDDIKDLKGKKIALEAGWVSHYFLLYLLHKNGLSSKDVTIVNCKGSDVGAALIKGEVDAAVTFEPWLSQAIQLSNGKLLASTKDDPILYDVFAGLFAKVEAKSEMIDKFLIAVLRATEYLFRDKDESARITASYFGISIEEFKMLLSRVNFFHEIEPNKFLSGKDAEALLEVIAKANEVFIDEKLISNVVKAEDLFWIKN